MKLVIALLSLNMLLSVVTAASEAMNVESHLITQQAVVEQRQTIAKLEDRVQKMNSLLTKMSKGLGYDGPDYWH